jgi:hypothetical protein
MSLKLLSQNSRYLFDLTLQDASFRQEIEQSPELGLLILDAMQEEESSSSLLQAQSSKRKRVTESSSGHELVPDQAGGANTIGANNQEQW